MCRTSSPALLNLCSKTGTRTLFTNCAACLTRIFCFCLKSSLDSQANVATMAAGTRPKRTSAVVICFRRVSLIGKLSARPPGRGVERALCSANRDSDTRAERSRIRDTEPSPRMVAPENRLTPWSPSPRDWMTAWTRPSSRSTATPTRWPAWRVSSNSCRTGSGPSARNRWRSETMGTSSPRTAMQGRSSARADRVPFKATHSSTCASGTTYLPPAVSTRSPSIRASVKGSRKMKAVPLPGVLSTATVPRVRRTASRTTSSPTPRPESSLTVSRVEKPGSKIRLTTRGSSAGVPGEIIPARSPCGRSSPGRAPGRRPRRGSLPGRLHGRPTA